MKPQQDIVAFYEDSGRIRMLLEMLIRAECSAEYAKKRLAEIDAENEAKPNG